MKFVLVFIACAVAGYCIGDFLGNFWIGVAVSPVVFFVVEILYYRFLYRDYTQKEKNESLDYAVHRDDMDSVIQFLFSGAKATSLRESTPRHAIRKIGRVLKFCRFIGH